MVQIGPALGPENVDCNGPEIESRTLIVRRSRSENTRSFSLGEYFSNSCYSPFQHCFNNTEKNDFNWSSNQKSVFRSIKLIISQKLTWASYPLFEVLEVLEALELYFGHLQFWLFLHFLLVHIYIYFDQSEIELLK